MLLHKWLVVNISHYPYKCPTCSGRGSLTKMVCVGGDTWCVQCNRHFFKDKQVKCWSMVCVDHILYFIYHHRKIMRVLYIFYHNDFHLHYSDNRWNRHIGPAQWHRFHIHNQIHFHYKLIKQWNNDNRKVKYMINWNCDLYFNK